ncbi:MAG: caspase family protein [Candidatus Nanoarchaeia archaeon]|nr:caspase family protein [Candidatus Nanoarchaeia archaeon]
MRKIGKNNVYVLDDLLGFREKHKKKIRYKNIFDKSVNIITKSLTTIFILMLYSKLVNPTVELINFNNRNKDYHIEPNKKAVLIQAREGNDIEVINHELKRRGYDCYIIDEQGTEKEIFESIDSIAEQSNDKTETVFYFSGHGRCLDNHDKFISVKNSNPDIEYLLIGPKPLYSRLDKIKGKKAIFIDSCYSGAFAKEEGLDKLIDNYVIITTCPEDYESFDSPFYIMGKRISPLTFDTYKLLQKNQNINLSEESISGNILSSIMSIPEEIIVKTRKEKTSFEKQRVSDTDFYL